VRIIESAHDHGIVDEDILHAIQIPVKDWDLDDNAIMRVGPARNSSLLEIGIADIDTNDPVIFHVMKCRKRFNPYLQ
jgi:hypothetical protein